MEYVTASRNSSLEFLLDGVAHLQAVVELIIDWASNRRPWMRQIVLNVLNDDDGSTSLPFYNRRSYGFRQRPRQKVVLEF